MTNGGGPHGHGAGKEAKRKTAAGEPRKTPAKKLLTAIVPKEKAKK